jgi:hypothetical protein
MTLGKRFRIYGIGLLIGIALSYFFMGDRLTTTAWMPKDRIKDRLGSTLIKASPAAQAELDARGIQLETVRSEMPRAEILLGDTERTEDTIFYHVKAEVNGQALDMTIAGMKDFSSDTTATLLRVQ